MKPILVTYTTMAGSTAEVAQAVADEMEKGGVPVDVRPLAQVPSLDGYAAVVVGGPMIMGWQKVSEDGVKTPQPVAH